jgi:anti-sigma regulatory factor (Ser/Thr protein kinase)
VVTFYGRESELIDAVTRFIGEGLDAGETAISLITQPHLQDVEAELRRRGFDIDAARLAGTFVTVDTESALSRHTRSGVFDASSLIGELGSLVGGMINASRKVRVFGELVAVLWSAGDVSAALELEDAWNELTRSMPFALLCAYPRSIAGDERGSIADVCAAHAAVVGGGADSAVAVVARAEHSRFFGCNLQSPGMARRFVVHVLRQWGRADLIDDAAIVTAELTTNAVLHAHSEFLLAVSRDGERIRVSVRDASPLSPRPTVPRLDSISGRGLGLVGTLARRWGTELLNGGKVVWAELG